MGDVVSDGESLTCTFCTGKVKLGVSSSPAKGDSNKLANTSNHSLSAPGAQCIVIPSAPAPCQPSAQNVVPGQSALVLDGSPAVGAGGMYMCCKGGLLTISSSAQSSAVHGGATGAESVTPPEISPLLPIENEPKDPDKEKTNEQKTSTRTKKGSIDPTLPKDPANDPNFEDVSHPEAANNGHYKYRNKTTGDVVRYDKAKPGEPGHKGQNHYHRENPKSTNKMDKYLDGNGNPVPDNSDASHLYPPD